MKYYLVGCPDGCTPYDCVDCSEELRKKQGCGRRYKPLTVAQEAKEVTNSLSRALQAKDGVKIWATAESSEIKP